MTALVMVPVLTLLDSAGRLDRGACLAYAQRARETWLDLFLVAGSLGLGSTMTRRARSELLAVWLEQVPVSRLVVCGWEPGEVEDIAQSGVRPMAVLQGAGDESAVLDVLTGVPNEAFVYSHPQYSPVTISAAVLAKARAMDALPAGAKMSKVGLDDIRAAREVLGSEFTLLDGRCRHLGESVRAGATGVVAVPLSVLPADLPPRGDVAGLQAVIDRVQMVVDGQPSVASQAHALEEILAASL